jgi:hypothetical protein
VTARHELEEYGFSPNVAGRLGANIHDPFPDFLILAEEILGKDGALTRSQLVYIEYLHRSHNIGHEREIWEALKRAPERERFAKKPSIRREVVVIFGHRVTVFRDVRTGRFVRRRRRR